MIFSLEFKKTRGELSQIYLCDAFFLTWILFFINPVILNIKVFTPITNACFLSSLEPLTMSLSPIYIMQPACFPLSIHCTIPYFKRVIAADSQEEER